MKTRGEEIFSEYLGSLGLQFNYEPPIGQRRPDFLVHSSSGDVLCEVKDFEPNDEDRAEIDAALAGRSRGDFREVPYDRIRRRIRKASETLREFKGRYPCLVVLFDASAQVALLDFTVLGAMHGNTLISVPIARDDSTDTDAKTTTVFDHESRYLTRTSNTTVSAVAILQYVSPNHHLLEEALSKQDFGEGPDRTSMILRFIYNFGEEYPHIFDRVPRLHMFLNVYAAVPWPTGALNGRHDLFWPSGHSEGAQS